MEKSRDGIIANAALLLLGFSRQLQLSAKEHLDDIKDELQNLLREGREELEDYRVTSGLATKTDIENLSRKIDELRANPAAERIPPSRQEKAHKPIEDPPHK